MIELTVSRWGMRPTRAEQRFGEEFTCMDAAKRADNQLVDHEQAPTLVVVTAGRGGATPTSRKNSASPSSRSRCSASEPRYVRRPFGKEPDFGATGVIDDLPELLARAEEPA